MVDVKIVEVGPRDGLQNISQLVPTGTKVELIKRLSRTGISKIEATLFVSPKWIPQLADGDMVLKAIQSLIASPQNNIGYPVLVPNVKGLEKAVQNGAREVAVFVSATESFSQKNINCSVAVSLVRVRLVTERARALGIKVRGYVSCIFEDPYEGSTDPEQVVTTTQALLDAGCYEVSLGDTLGVGTPSDVGRLFTRLLRTVPASSIAAHFHDTYGQAIANVMKAYALGIRTFDSSVAGLGGCPFAKGAKGNLATEDLVYTLEKSGVSTGVDLDELVKIGAWISQELGIPNGSRAGSAIASKTHKNDAPKSSLPTRVWHTLESTREYRVRRSSANVEICLTRGENGNALTQSLIQGLIKLFETFARDGNVSRIILRGEGKYFCTGIDLKGAISNQEQFLLLRALFHAIDECPKTTIAVINGPCFGGGVGLAFVCDIRLAVSKATFTLSEVRLGLCPATISKYIVREWGFSYARTAMLTTRQITVSELAGLQVIQGVATDEASLDTTLDIMLEELRFAAPEASRLSKELVKVAYADAGGKQQARVIKSSLDRMMGPGSEHSHARSEFKRGVRKIDWETINSVLCAKL